MVTWAVGNNRCTAMASTWLMEWRMRNRAGLSLVLGRWIAAVVLSIDGAWVVTAIGELVTESPGVGQSRILGSRFSWAKSRA